MPCLHAWLSKPSAIQLSCPLLFCSWQAETGTASRLSKGSCRLLCVILRIRGITSSWPAELLPLCSNDLEDATAQDKEIITTISVGLASNVLSAAWEAFQVQHRSPTA